MKTRKIRLQIKNDVDKDFKAFRKALTPQRFKLLSIIKKENPSSIRELSKLVKRDLKNVADDINYLAKAGLVGKKIIKKKTELKVNYDKVVIEIIL